ncbi:MAG: tetratricopeptide repeat protein [Deltaproteobacteria bacterium]|nr:tetratricopeptide repeat protein [Deltaproteobacteria bacterium]
MNVRCPHCSAVFSSGDVPAGAVKSVECPLCLMRFEAQDEMTASVASLSAQRPLPSTAPGSEVTDAVGGLGSRTVHLGSGTSLSGSPKVVPTIVADADADIDIDFEALLSDASSAVDKHSVSQRTNPFARVAAPRSGAPPALDQEAIFAGAARRPSQVAPSAFDLAPTQVLAPGFSPLGDAPSPAPLASAPASPAVAPPEEDSLFEAGTATADADSDMPRSRPIGIEPIDRRPARNAGRGKGKSQGKGKPLFTFDRLLAAAMLLAAAGVATDYAGLGVFASKLWRAEAPDKNRPQRAVPADLTKAVALDDTRQTYELELARLDKLARLRKDDAQVQARRIGLYLDLYERYPEALEEPEIKAGFENLKKAGALPKARLAALDAYAKEGPAAALAHADALKGGSPDDRGLLARMYQLDFQQRLRRQALDRPGLTAAPDTDPLRTPAGNDVGLAAAATLIDGVLAEHPTLDNTIKFKALRGAIADAQGKYAAAEAHLTPLVKAAPENLEVRLTLASALLDAGKPEQAQPHLDKITVTLVSSPQPWVAREQNLIVARQAGRRGDHDSQISALSAVLESNPSDELTTVRVARLNMLEKHLDDANKLLLAGKNKHKFKSVAFVVAMTEYWLLVNRNDDALAEISEATKAAPDSLELLYLRGQVEDKQSHYATARDYFAQVLQREPRHLRAAIRLAELQSAAGRHDEALATLEQARKNVGDEENLLRLAAEELSLLKRDDEARKLLTQLLTAQPDNRRYLLRAAQMDLRSGNPDVALESLRKLRAQKALDRQAATQMTMALVDKKNFAEAAATIEPFADEAPTDIELNTLAGKVELDAGQVEKAAVYIGRAVQTANGKSAEALFQHGRLAFRKGEVAQGISRIKQAIDVDTSAHFYRFELARQLLDRHPDAPLRKLAVDQLQTVVHSAAAFEQVGKPVRYLPEVYRLLAKAFLIDHQYAKAVAALKSLLELKPDDLDGKAQLGRCYVEQGNDDGGRILRDVLAHRPGDDQAALYLALHLMGHRQYSDALPLLQQAANSGAKDLAEAWYHLALIHKERDQLGQALKAVETYLERSPADNFYRADAASLKKVLQTTLGAKKTK